MDEPTYQQIVRFPVIQYYEVAFREATGVPLAVVPPEEPVRRWVLGRCENRFCVLAAGTGAGHAGCIEAQARAHGGVGSRSGAKQVNCFAGLTDVAIPVVVRGRHVATLISGQVLRREPTERDFSIVLGLLAKGQDGAWQARLRNAYFATPVVNAERFEAIIHLLGMFAQYLAHYIDTQAIAVAPEEPPAVSSAKRFVLEHIDQPIALDEVIQHVGVSRFYFCKLFRKATGMTLTDFVTRVRLENAKTLLRDPAMRISEVVYASGFGSIPRFNNVFKRHMGMAPSAFRASLRLNLQS